MWQHTSCWKHPSTWWQTLRLSPPPFTHFMKAPSNNSLFDSICTKSKVNSLWISVFFSTHFNPFLSHSLITRRTGYCGDGLFGIFREDHFLQSSVTNELNVPGLLSSCWRNRHTWNTDCTACSSENCSPFIHKCKKNISVHKCKDSHVIFFFFLAVTWLLTGELISDCFLTNFVAFFRESKGVYSTHGTHLGLGWW